MPEPVAPDVAVYLCRNCLPDGERLPHQWRQDGLHVLVREVPCSGKIDGQYLLHALEGGGYGLCVVGCPKGDCSLAEGNYRAEVRVRMVRRLLAEIGIESDRAEFVHCRANDSLPKLETRIRDSVKRICALGESPIRG